MDENGMEHSGVANERCGAAIVFQGDAGFGQQRTVGDVFAVPVGDVSEGFGNEEVRALLGKLLGDSGDHVTQPETGKPDLRLARRAERRTGQAGQFFFCRLGRWTTDLLAMDQQRFAAIMLLQGENVAVWQLGFGEGDSWFHGA